MEGGLCVLKLITERKLQIFKTKRICCQIKISKSLTPTLTTADRGQLKLKPFVAFSLRSNLSCGDSYFITVARSFHVPLSRVRDRVYQLFTSLYMCPSRHIISLGRALPGLVLAGATGSTHDWFNNRGHKKQVCAVRARWH